MVQHIFLILCGENEQHRPRSNQLLSLLQHQTNYKVIVSGFSSFTIDPESSESFRLSRYLVQEGIARSDIILEERSMDTLGNIVFSHIITEKLLDKYPLIHTITLITETFHLHRSQILFTRIFAVLLYKHQVQSYFVGTKLRDRYDLKAYWRSFIHSIEVRLREQAILELVLADFTIFRLSTFGQFKDYLFNLPVYNTVYQATKKMNIGISMYSRAIQYMMKLRKNQMQYTVNSLSNSSSKVL